MNNNLFGLKLRLESLSRRLTKVAGGITHPETCQILLRVQMNLNLADQELAAAIAQTPLTQPERIAKTTLALLGMTKAQLELGLKTAKTKLIMTDKEYAASAALEQALAALTRAAMAYEAIVLPSPTNPDIANNSVK